MKIDIHSSYINNLVSPQFFNCASEQLPDLVAKKYSNKIRKLQFYSYFFSKNGSYLFVDSKKIYYPLTVVFSNGKWETAWILWSREDVGEKQFAISPFSPLKDITFELCEDIDKRFQDAIEGKLLYYEQKKSLPNSVIRITNALETKGKICQAFADVLCQQIGGQITEMSGKDLSPRWDIEILDTDETLAIKQRYLRRVVLKNGLAECIDLAVVWKETVDVSDFISTKDVNFLLAFDDQHYSKDRLISFVNNNGF